MKKLKSTLGVMEASLNGSLDGLELDNTDDVIEKSVVIEMVYDLKKLLKEAQNELKNNGNQEIQTNKPHNQRRNGL